eukprot:scaffold2188_cov388-Prasinococcus_capsulatus_cf.AAC.11
MDPAAFHGKTPGQIAQKERWWKRSYWKLRTLYPEKETHPWRAQVVALSPRFVAWSYQLYQEFRKRMQKMNIGDFSGEH